LGRGLAGARDRAGGLACDFPADVLGRLGDGFGGMGQGHGDPVAIAHGCVLVWLLFFGSRVTGKRPWAKCSAKRAPRKQYSEGLFPRRPPPFRGEVAPVGRGTCPVPGTRRGHGRERAGGHPGRGRNVMTLREPSTSTGLGTFRGPSTATGPGTFREPSTATGSELSVIPFLERVEQVGGGVG